MDKQEFDEIIAEIAKIMAKYNCELVITSEISFKKIDGNKTEITKIDKKTKRIRK